MRESDSVSSYRSCESLRRAWTRQVHRLGERAHVLYERAAVLYESAAAIFRLPQGRSAFAEALSKEAASRGALAEALFEEPPVRCELAEVACEDTLEGSEVVEAAGKTQARRRELVPSREPLSRVRGTPIEVTGHFDGDRHASVADRSARSSSTGVLAPRLPMPARERSPPLRRARSAAHCTGAQSNRTRQSTIVGVAK
jgi:hypothetical protein